MSGTASSNVFGSAPAIPMEEMKKKKDKMFSSKGKKEKVILDELLHDKKEKIVKADKLSMEEVDAKLKGKKVKSKEKELGITRAARAGVIFPVARIHNKLKHLVPSHARVGGTAAVFMAAVLEYLVAEMCESAGDRAKRGKAENGPKRSRITPRIIQLTIREDPEFNSLLQRVTVAGGGVLPLSDESIKKMVHARTAQAMETKQNIAAAQEGITPGAEMTPGEEPIYAGDVTPGGDLTPAEEA